MIYSLYTLKCSANKIFKSTTGGRKFCLRPPVVALNENSMFRVYLTGIGQYTQNPGSSAYTQHWVLYTWDELIMSISQVGLKGCGLGSFLGSFMLIKSHDKHTRKQGNAPLDSVCITSILEP